MADIDVSTRGTSIIMLPVLLPCPCSFGSLRSGRHPVLPSKPVSMYGFVALRPVGNVDLRESKPPRNLPWKCTVSAPVHVQMLYMLVGARCPGWVSKCWNSLSHCLCIKSV